MKSEELVKSLGEATLACLQFEYDLRWALQIWFALEGNNDKDKQSLAMVAEKNLDNFLDKNSSDVPQSIEKFSNFQNALEGFNSKYSKSLSNDLVSTRNHVFHGMCRNSNSAIQMSRVIRSRHGDNIRVEVKEADCRFFKSMRDRYRSASAEIEKAVKDEFNVVSVADYYKDTMQRINNQ